MMTERWGSEPPEGYARCETCRRDFPAELIQFHYGPDIWEDVLCAQETASRMHGQPISFTGDQNQYLMEKTKAFLAGDYDHT